MYKGEKVLGKFVDLTDTKDKRIMSHHRLKQCRYRKSCIPVVYEVDNELKGVCCGIVHKSKNLDCIRTCLFFFNAKKEVESLSYFMTPAEALGHASCLISTTKVVLERSSSYDQYHTELVKIRESGNNHPAELLK
jgi:hypothetical protein